MKNYETDEKYMEYLASFMPVNGSSFTGFSAFIFAAT